MDCHDPDGSRNDGTPAGKSTSIWRHCGGKCIGQVLRLTRVPSLRGNSHSARSNPEQI